MVHGRWKRRQVELHVGRERQLALSGLGGDRGDQDTQAAHGMSTEELLVNAENKVIVLARLDAAGFKTVTAFSSAYDTTFPESLDGIISRKEFKFCIDVINQTLEDYYPCVPCYVCGYLCCLTTFGLSMLMPEPCTKELSRNLDVVLRRLNNREEFLYRGIVWRFHRSPRTHSSWIEICQLLYE